jgi:hypothetical protein
MTLSINLQWLALPFLLLGIYWLSWGLYGVSLLFTKEIGPMIGMITMFQYGLPGLGSLALSWLIHFAFRKV